MNNKSKLRFVTFLTFVRFPLVLLFFTVAIIYTCTGHRWEWLFTLAFIALSVSAITDLFDGYFARKFGVVTKFGAHADPLMDKFFYLSTLPLLVFVASRNNHIQHAVIILVMTMMFLTRDQWVTFLRSIGSIYNVSGKANWSGKLRTCINFPVICAIYHIEESPFKLINMNLMYFFEVVALIINIISLVIYTRYYWPYLIKATHTNSSE